MTPVNLFNHTSLASFVIPTDRPNTIRICLIEHFGAYFVLALGVFYAFSVFVRDFVIGLSQIFPLSRNQTINTICYNMSKHSGYNRLLEIEKTYITV